MTNRIDSRVERALATFTSLVVLGLIVSACSSSGSSVPTGSGSSSVLPGANGKTGSTGTPGTSSPSDTGERVTPVFRCCLTVNDVESTYSCPSKEATEKCSGVQTNDGAQCMANCAGDPACMQKCANSGPPTPPDPSQCEKVKAVASEWCKPPPKPGNLCTAGQPTCKDAGDCFDKIGPGTWCNSVKGRCFASLDNCVGEPCADDRDCGAGGDGRALETCDETTHKCVLSKT